MRCTFCVLCPGPVSTDFIDSSRRNLPGDVPAPVVLTPEESLFRKAFEIYLERGLEPRLVAGQVLDAIRSERFYVIPRDYNAAIETRMRNILNAENPELPQPTKVFSGIVEELVKSGLKTPSKDSEC